MVAASGDDGGSPEGAAGFGWPEILHCLQQGQTLVFMLSMAAADLYVLPSCNILINGEEQHGSSELRGDAPRLARGEKNDVVLPHLCQHDLYIRDKGNKRKTFSLFPHCNCKGCLFVSKVDGGNEYYCCMGDPPLCKKSCTFHACLLYTLCIYMYGYCRVCCGLASLTVIRSFRGSNSCAF